MTDSSTVSSALLFGDCLHSSSLTKCKTRVESYVIHREWRRLKIQIGHKPKHVVHVSRVNEIRSDSTLTNFVVVYACYAARSVSWYRNISHNVFGYESDLKNQKKTDKTRDVDSSYSYVTYTDKHVQLLRDKRFAAVSIRTKSIGSSTRVRLLVYCVLKKALNNDWSIFKRLVRWGMTVFSFFAHFALGRSTYLVRGRVWCTWIENFRSGWFSKRVRELYEVGPS